VPAPADVAASQAWIKVRFARHGLAFMLDQPVRAIRAELGKLLAAAITAAILLAIAFALVFAKGVEQTAGLVGRKDKLTGHVNTWHQLLADSRNGALIVLAAVVVLFIVQGAGPTLLEWSRVGGSIALMLSFVALSFLSGDTWRLAGELPWWRLATLAAVFLAAALIVLYRHAAHAIDEVLARPLETRAVAVSIRKLDPLVRDILSTEPDWRPAPPGRALRNLRLVTAVLLARRVLIGGVAVAAALFTLGLIIIGEAGTSGLLNGHSAALTGATGSFGLGHYTFFWSEAMAKVCLTLGALAAAYFVLANPDPDREQDQDTLVTAFIRKGVVLWACYQALAAARAAPAAARRRRQVTAAPAGPADHGAPGSAAP
jgi:hypothetical protein